MHAVMADRQCEIAAIASTCDTGVFMNVLAQRQFEIIDAYEAVSAVQASKHMLNFCTGYHYMVVDRLSNACALCRS